MSDPITCPRPFNPTTTPQTYHKHTHTQIHTPGGGVRGGPSGFLRLPFREGKFRESHSRDSRSPYLRSMTFPVKVTQLNF